MSTTRDQGSRRLETIQKRLPQNRQPAQQVAAEDDRRGFDRTAVDDPVKVEHSGGTDLCLSVDVSPTGIAFVHTSPLRGSVIITIGADSRTPIRLRAEVVRFERVGRFYKMGARFLERLDDLPDRVKRQRRRA